MTNSTDHHTSSEKNIGIFIGIEILFLVLYVAWILFFWFRRWFKTDDDVITRHHIIHMKKLEEQQAAFEKMQKDNYVEAPKRS